MGLLGLANLTTTPNFITAAASAATGTKPQAGSRPTVGVEFRPRNRFTNHDDLTALLSETPA
jgi:hypothetical protein